MNTNQDLIRSSATQNPFATVPCSGTGLASSVVVALAYAALFAGAVSRNDLRQPEALVTVAAASAPSSAPANWGLEIRGLSKAELATGTPRTDVGTAIAAQGQQALERIRLEARQSMSLAAMQSRPALVASAKPVEVAAALGTCDYLRNTLCDLPGGLLQYLRSLISWS